MERPRGVMGMGMVMVEVMDMRAATDCILQLLSSNCRWQSSLSPSGLQNGP